MSDKLKAVLRTRDRLAKQVKSLTNRGKSSKSRTPRNQSIIKSLAEENEKQPVVPVKKEVKVDKALRVK